MRHLSHFPSKDHPQISSHGTNNTKTESRTLPQEFINLQDYMQTFEFMLILQDNWSICSSDFQTYLFFKEYHHAIPTY